MKNDVDIYINVQYVYYSFHIKFFLQHIITMQLLFQILDLM